MKKILYILADILETALLAGACIIQYFAKRKMGMMRWVAYKESKIKKVLPIEILRFVVPVILLLIVIWLLMRYHKNRKELKKAVFLIAVFTGVFALFYLGFTLIGSTEKLRAYYLVLPLIGVANVVQIIKMGIAMLICKK